MEEHMILRKLTIALKEQNWSTVLLEILIVVVGIYVGLQVDGWNEARKDKAKGKIYLERLARDIERDADLLSRSIQSADNRVADAILAMNGLADPTLLESDPCQFLASIGRVSQNFFPVLYSHTFTEIVSSGHLELIKNDDLKDELGQYYTAHESAEQWMDSYRQINLDYAKAFAGVLNRDQLKAVARFEDGDQCQIDIEQAMAARQRILDREGLSDWLPRLEIRQERLSQRLQRSHATNALLKDLISTELNRYGSDSH